jgi:hypothetical protein
MESEGPGAKGSASGLESDPVGVLELQLLVLVSLRARQKYMQRF